MKIRFIFCLLAGLMVAMPVLAWPIKDLMSFKNLTIESVAQEGVKTVQDQIKKATDQLLETTGNLGNLSFDPKSLFGTTNNPLVGDIQPISVSVPSLGLTGETIKNPFVTQGVLNQTVMMPVNGVLDLTTAQKNAILSEQEKLVQSLAVQGVAKANVDKVKALLVESKTDAAEKMINSAKTERESAQASAHTMVAMATEFSLVVDKASANLAIKSGENLSKIDPISESKSDEADKKSKSTVGG